MSAFGGKADMDARSLSGRLAHLIAALCRAQEHRPIDSEIPGNRLALKPELLREPNHHERKSNQKEEDARACAVVLRSHSRTAVS
jgi:hypothetical protein